MVASSPDIDERLILRRAVRERDRSAVASLYLMYYPRIKSYIASRINSDADIEDLAHDVIVQLCTGKSHYDGSSDVESYLLGIARNMIGRYHRRSRRSVEIMCADSTMRVCLKDDTGQDPDPARRISAEQLKRIMEDPQLKLSPKARQSIMLRFVEGLKPREAAGKAECSLAAFYKRLERAAKALRETGKHQE